MKIFSLVYICFFILLTISIISGLSLNQVQQQVVLVSEYHEKMSVQSISILHQISAQYEKMFRLIKEQVMSQTDKTEYEFVLQQLRSSISQYNELAFSINSREEFLAPLEMRDMMGNFANDMNSIVDNSERTSNQIALLLENENSNDEQIATLLKDLEMDYKNIFGIVGSALEMEITEKNTQQEQIDRYYVDSHFVVLAMVVFMGSTLIIIITLLKPQISKNIEILKNSTSKIAKGDFKTRILLTGSKDEIFDLATNVNKMAEELEKNQSKILAEKQIEFLFENSPDYILTLNEDMIILDCNENYAMELGYEKNELIGKSGFDLVDKDDLENARKRFGELKEKGFAQAGIKTLRKDGSTLSILWSGMKHEDENGILLGYLVTGKNITELHQARDKLLEKEKFEILGQLAANIAHDIKNPLTSLRNSVQIIEKKTTADDELTNKETRRMNKAIKRMVHQVDQVLHYVKTLPLLAEHTTVLTILKQSLDIITIPDNITIEIPEKDFEVKWDETQISVVFTNIILNAAQAIEKNNGKISIRVAQENDFIKIEIENTGPNIPEKDLDMIFKPLYTTKMEGTGLGLAGCKNIIQSHMGSITVSNNPVKFTMKIPKSF